MSSTAAHCTQYGANCEYVGGDGGGGGSQRYVLPCIVFPCW